MQELLAKIIEMDEKARNIRLTAEQEKLRSEQEIEELRQKIYDDYIARAKDRVEKNIAVDREQAEKRFAEYSVHAEELMVQMQESYEKNGERWADEITAIVLGK